MGQTADAPGLVSTASFVVTSVRCFTVQWWPVDPKKHLRKGRRRKSPPVPFSRRSRQLIANLCVLFLSVFADFKMLGNQN